MNALNRYADPVYCMMRFIVGLMLACHGGQLVLAMFGGMPGSEKMVTQVGGWLQLIGGFLIAFGLLTRLAAFICSGMFAVACFMLPLPPRRWRSFSQSPPPALSSPTKESSLSSIAGSFSLCFSTARDAGALMR